MTRTERDALRDGWRDAGWYQDVTFGEAIATTAADQPDASIVFAGADGTSTTATIGQLFAEGDALAGSLRALGVQPGGSVILQGPADRSSAVGLVALCRLGVTVVALGASATAAEVGHAAAQTGADTILVTPRWRGDDVVGPIRRRAEELGLRSVIALDDDLPSAEVGIVPKPAPTDVAVVLYTSGSTAVPKGVKHTHETMLFGLLLTPPDPTKRTLAAFPAGHVAGLYGLVRPLTSGDHTVILDRWSARRAAELIEHHRITSTAGTPFFLTTLLDEARRVGRDISSLCQFLCGAAAVPPALVARAEDLGILTWRTYGSTEHPAIATGIPDDPVEKRQHTDGRPFLLTEVRVVDESGDDVGVDEDGEILSRGPAQFVGYCDRELDDEVFTDRTWFRTGDRGHIDPDGYLVVTDRVKDVIIRGGENISAREVEEVLLTHPTVEEVAVCAAPDPTFGEVPAAIVVGTTTLDDLVATCERAGLARHKCPAKLVLVDELPRTPAGKVRKRDLRPLLDTP